MKKTIAFITDTHLSEKLPVTTDQEKHWNIILEDVRSRQLDAIVIGGDIGEPGSYPEFFESLRRFDGDVSIIPGNHDLTSALLPHFANPEHPDSAELYYSSSDGNFLYLFLDSSTDAISEPQLHWLGEKLEGNQSKILLFIHHPIYEVDSYVDRKYPLQNRDAVRSLLENQQHEVFIFCGHYHCQDETGSGAISQYTTPAVSYQVRKGTQELDAHSDYFGYRLITLENGNVKNETIEFSS
ncbi:metallophosphoesterase family protein [Flavobacterium selenitireducens]|uniref:metallophosphoesterase family protein n=1 Tax=Flavobacterium selenitireducens TaxID=2722704 RepID=UPI00168BD6BE|nr:metallophosphoesterase [Flavobacterium selenitireducens]MBD3582715.1 metallophosphoesterase [Flavobacterium selenitireducens]